MIVDDKEELDVIFDYMKDKTVLVVPVLSDHKLHPIINNISFPGVPDLKPLARACSAFFRCFKFAQLIIGQHFFFGPL